VKIVCDVTAVNVLVLLEHHARWIKYLSFNDIPHEQEISASTDGSGYLPLFMLYLSPLMVNSYLIQYI